MAGNRSRFTLILLSLIALCVVILVVGLVILQQQVAQAEQLNAATQRINAEYNTAFQETTSLPDRQKDLEELNTKLTSVDQNLVDYKYIPTYLKQLQKIATDTGNSIHSIAPHELHVLDLQKSKLVAGKAPDAGAGATPDAGANTAAKPGQYQLQPITLEIEGSYLNLVKFLDALRKFPKLVYVRNLSITPQIRNNVMTVTTTLDTYAIITPDQYKPSTDALASGGGKK